MYENTIKILNDSELELRLSRAITPTSISRVIFSILLIGYPLFYHYKRFLLELTNGFKDTPQIWENGLLLVVIFLLFFINVFSWLRQIYSAALFSEFLTRKQIILAGSNKKDDFKKDVIVLFVAIIFGIVIGAVILKFFAPELSSL